MRYPPHLLDEIRARLPVSRVVERRVKLKRTGREYTGLSPFKNERTPSFTVNDQKGFYHCFASGENGDIFKFLMATEGLSFPEAVERLAAEAGVTLPPPVPCRRGEGVARGAPVQRDGRGLPLLPGLALYPRGNHGQGLPGPAGPARGRHPNLPPGLCPGQQDRAQEAI